MNNSDQKPKFFQGLYKPKNKSKYKGNLQKIIFRSSYELQFMHYCDNNPGVLEWASEELAIPYVKPTDGKIHRYFLDFWMKYVSNDYERTSPYWNIVTLNNTPNLTVDIYNSIIQDDGRYNVIRGDYDPDPIKGRIGELFFNTTKKILYIKKDGDIILDPNGKPIYKIKKLIVEIKPFSQTLKPKQPIRITNAYKKKLATFLVNASKWQAAEEFASKRGMEFKIITEKWLKNAR